MPDLEKNSNQTPTLLLAQNTAAGGQALAHLAKKTDVVAIYTADGRATVQPLANALGLPVNPLDSNDVPAAIAQILHDHGNSVVVISGSNDILREVLEAVGAYPTPAMFSGEDDNIFVVTLHEGNEARLLNLRY